MINRSGMKLKGYGRSMRLYDTVLAFLSCNEYNMALTALAEIPGTVELQAALNSALKAERRGRRSRFSQSMTVDAAVRAIERAAVAKAKGADLV
jgi:hypothetical protein